jgi:hypothetical protein
MPYNSVISHCLIGYMNAVKNAVSVEPVQDEPAKA